MVHPIFARWHAFIDAVKAFRLLKAGDLMLGGEPADSWRDEEENTYKGIRLVMV